MNKIAIYSIFFVFLSACNSLAAVVILIHGTFASKEQWCKPGGIFYTELQKQAELHNHNIVPFNWSGELSSKARLKAAYTLAKIIISYSVSEEIILIGHSHGGTLIHLASRILGGTFYTTDAIGNDDKNSLIKDFEILQSLLKCQSGKHYLIDRVYLLGTPINLKHYAPDMNIIGFIYNFYSKGDCIQPVFGTYQRKISGCQRAINFSISIRDKSSRYYPSHSQMHHPVIARWILNIPYHLFNEKVRGFQYFSPACDGKIYFNTQRSPRYKLICPNCCQKSFLEVIV